MSRLSLGYFIVRFRFNGMNNVGELDGILDEEDRDVVTDYVPVSFLSVHFDGESAHIADGVLEISR